MLFCNTAALAKVTRIFLSCCIRQMSLHHRRSVLDISAVLSLNDALCWLPLPWQQSATRVTVNDRRCITPPTVADQSMKLYYTFSLRRDSAFLPLPSPLQTLLPPHFPSLPPSVTLVPSSHYHPAFSPSFPLSSFIPTRPSYPTLSGLFSPLFIHSLYPSSPRRLPPLAQTLTSQLHSICL